MCPQQIGRTVMRPEVWLTEARWVNAPALRLDRGPWLRSHHDQAREGLLALPGREADAVGHAVAVAVEDGDRDGPESRRLERRQELGLQRPGVGEGDPDE